MLIVEEDAQILKDETVTNPITLKIAVNKFNHLTLRGIAHENKTTLTRIMTVVINYFIANYWKDDVDRKFDIIHKMNFKKEFMMDYAKWLVENDEDLFNYAKKLVARKYREEPHRMESDRLRKQEEREADVDKTNKYHKEYKRKKRAEEISSTKAGTKYKKTEMTPDVNSAWFDKTAFDHDEENRKARGKAKEKKTRPAKIEVDVKDFEPLPFFNPQKDYKANNNAVASKWRVDNRERYNEYHRNYRKKKKEERMIKSKIANLPAPG